MSDAWGDTSVWVTFGVVRAVLHKDEGGITPILVRGDAPEGLVPILIDGHTKAANALNRAADHR